MKKAILLCILIFHLFLVRGQETHTLSGYIKDVSSGEALIGAKIFLTTLGKGATTNVYGFYSLSVETGSYELEISYIGYKDYKAVVDLANDQRLNVELEIEDDLLDEIVVEAKADDQNIKSVDMGQIELSMDKIKTLPACKIQCENKSI